MTNNAEKEKWIEETFSSLEGVQQVHVSASLHEKIVDRSLYDNAVKVRVVKLFPRIAAAAALLLVVVNVLSVLHFTKNTTVKEKHEVYEDVQHQLKTLTDDSY